MTDKTPEQAVEQINNFEAGDVQLPEIATAGHIFAADQADVLKNAAAVTNLDKGNRFVVVAEHPAQTDPWGGPLSTDMVRLTIGGTWIAGPDGLTSFWRAVDTIRAESEA